MYWTFGFSMLFLFMLSYPPTDYVIQGKDGVIAFSTSMGLWPFIATLFVPLFFKWLERGKQIDPSHLEANEEETA